VSAKPPENGEALRSKAASSARWMSAATATRIVTQLLQVFILGRLLLPDDFGLMGMVMTVVVFGQAMGDAGLSNAIIHYQDATRRELSSLYWLNVLAGVLVFVLVWLAASLVADLYDEPRLTGILKLASFVFLVVPLGQQFQVLHEKELLFRRVALIEIAASLVGLWVAVSCALRGLGVHSLVWALLSHTTVKSLLLSAIGWVRWRPQMRLRARECRRFFRFSAFQVGERFLNQLGSQMDRVILGITLGARPLGFYYVAHNLALRPFQIINPIVTRVAFPVLARVQKRDDALRSGFLQMIELIAAVLVPLYAALAVLAEPILHVGPGPQWGPSVPLLQVLAFVGMVLSLGNPMGSLILAKGRAGVAFTLQVIRLALDVVAITIAARYSVRAVAVAVLIVRAGVMFPLGFYVRWMLVRMRPAEYLATIAPFFVAAAAMAAAVFAASRLVAWPSHLIELVACLALGALVYVGLLVTWQRGRVSRIVRNVRS
jgi:O-antigen/teichoic acid export membrane protein